LRRGRQKPDGANQTSTRRPFSLRTAHGPGYATENRVAAKRDILRNPLEGRVGIWFVFRSDAVSLNRSSRRTAPHHRSPPPPRRVATPLITALGALEGPALRLQPPLGRSCPTVGRLKNIVCPGKTAVGRLLDELLLFRLQHFGQDRPHLLDGELFSSDVLPFVVLGGCGFD
jgi:hypothetical protein